MGIHGRERSIPCISIVQRSLYHRHPWYRDLYIMEKNRGNRQNVVKTVWNTSFSNKKKRQKIRSRQNRSTIINLVKVVIKSVKNVWIVNTRHGNHQKASKIMEIVITHILSRTFICLASAKGRASNSDYFAFGIIENGQFCVEWWHFMVAGKK